MHRSVIFPQWLCCSCRGSATQPAADQPCLWGGKYHITKTVRNLAYRFAFGVAAICAVILFLLRGNAAYLFGTSETVAVRVAQILPIFIVGFVFVSVSRVTTAYFYAMGKNLWAYVLIYGGTIDPLRFASHSPQCYGQCRWHLDFSAVISNHCHADQRASHPKK